MKNKIILFLFLTLTILSLGIVSFASEEKIEVMLNGKYIDFTDNEGNVVEPQIINDRTMVPFRKIFNSFEVNDEDIKWIRATQTVKAHKDDVDIELQIGSNIAKKTISGETAELVLDSAPVIIDGRTLVPVRFIAESMNKIVGWDSENRSVIIIDSQKVAEKLKEAMPKYFSVIDSMDTNLNTFKSKTTINGKINYTVSNDRTSNSNLVLSGTVEVNKSEDAMYANVNLKFTGKGSIYDAIKESGLTGIDIKGIISKDAIYVYSTLLEEYTDKKWVCLKAESIGEILELVNNVTLEDVLISKNDLTIYTYAQIESEIELLKLFLGDDNITVSGTKTKKVTINIDLAKIINELGLDVEIPKCDMKMVDTIENGFVTTSTCNAEMEVKEDKEKVTIKINATTKASNQNKAVKIDIPGENEIMVME